MVTARKGAGWPKVEPYDPRDQQWRDQAACRGLDPELFMTERGEKTAEAKRACRGCPVVGPCLEYAIENRMLGCWGGTSDRERRRIRQERDKESAA